MKIQTAVKNLDNYKIYLQVEKAVNEFLEKNNYLKVDLPVLSPALIPESYLEVFETEFKFLGKKEKLYLTPSPELFLKRLLAFGVGDCYYLGKSFRNADPPASLHSYEFAMLEFYKMNANYMDIAEEVLKILRYINKKVKNKFVSFKKWEKISITEAFAKYSHISEKELFDHKLFTKKAQQKGYKTKKFSYENLWSQIYSQEIEPHLGKNGFPTLIYDYPKEFAALAKLNTDGRTTQRFEFYINGIELGDCYTELTDWKEQELRFKSEGKVIHPIDKGYIEALKYGLRDCSGIAIGLERLAMIFANVKSIDELKLINIV
ncbi:MAG: amino acid--tRNA ligase-related protein [Patescibacteria group bacterium]|jgi:elongation factor P--beta-lysine ligase